MQFNVAAYTLLGLPGYSDLSNEACVAKASALSVRRTSSVKQTSASIVTYLKSKGVPDAVERYAALFRALGRAGYEFAQQSLGGEGLDFSSDLVVDAIRSLVQKGEFNEQEAQLLGSIGVWYVSEWEEAGGTGIPTPDDFAGARRYREAQSIRAWVSARYNAVIDAIEAGSVASIDAARSALGA